MFSCTHGEGFSDSVSRDPRHISVQKLPLKLNVQFVKSGVLVETLEGDVSEQTGDAIVTGLNAEKWPVLRHLFLGKYAPVSPTKLGEYGQYQTLQKVYNALQINENFVVALPGNESLLQGAPDD